MVHSEAVLAEIDQQFPESLDRLFELLRFPSIGTDPAHNKDCLATANWLVGQLTAMGFEAGLRKTTGQPLVLGRYVPPGGEKLPHILFYGHYDVQPADPLELWTSPPFEPEIRKGSRGQDAIFARGSSDDKGQLMTFLEASRSWLKVHGSLPFRLTVMIEGDEEGAACVVKDQRQRVREGRDSAPPSNGVNGQRDVVGLRRVKEDLPKPAVVDQRDAARVPAF